MAKIYFQKEYDVAENSKIGIALNDTERDYLIGSAAALSTVKEFDITDAEYEGLVNGTKTLSFANNSFTVSDNPVHIDDTAHFTKKNLLDVLHTMYKKVEIAIKEKPNHSKINSLNELKTFLESIDADALSYPHVCLDKHLWDNNKYLNLNFI